MVAIMLVDGTVSFAAAHDTARMREASVLAQRAKVELVPDAELDRRVREAKVTIVLADGRELSEHVRPCAAPPTIRCRARRSSANAAT